MVQAVVALGGNVGDVVLTFSRARTLIEQHPHVHSVEPAGLYRSEPMGADAGDQFFNSAWVVETTLDAHSLLDLLQAVENELGRIRDVRWGPRTLDLDLIFYGDEQIDSPRLIVPHPHCWYRRFVLTPVASLVPDFIHPVLGLPVSELVRRTSMKPFVLAVGGYDDSDATVKSILAEFPGVELLTVRSTADVDVSEVSLAVWGGKCEHETLPSLWLSIPSNSFEQVLRDTLTAASTDLTQINESRCSRG